ncbi:MAG: hypothetical protein GY861_25860 [bacterium]|nr:hypothetical protein [bacterium]
MKIKAILGGVLVCSLLTGGAISSHMSKDSVEVTITGKERINTQDTSYYLVFTDKGAFKNDDDLWQLKFDSSELQAKLIEGDTYTCTKNFWRVPFLSMYENLLMCQPTNKY